MSLDRHPSGLDAAARASSALARVAERTRIAAVDLLAPDGLRPSDEERAALDRALRDAVGWTEAALHGAIARTWGDHPVGQGRAFSRLRDAGSFEDPDLIEELAGQTGLDLLAGSLPASVRDPDHPSLLPRFAECGDPEVAAAARSLMAAESRRRDLAPQSELPAELQHRLTWRVAAAIRAELGDTPDPLARDRAIEAAVEQVLADYDEGQRVEHRAVRLAAAIDARPAELPELLDEALGDRRLALFVAALARADGLDFEQARAITLDRDGSALWLALHAAGLERPALARIGLALSEADPRRDLDAAADGIDWAVALPRDEARRALAPMMLHRDFGTAVRWLERAR